MNPSLTDFLLFVVTDVIVNGLALLLDLFLALNIFSNSAPSVDNVLADPLHILNTNFHLQQRKMLENYSNQI